MYGTTIRGGSESGAERLLSATMQRWLFGQKLA